MMESHQRNAVAVVVGQLRRKSPQAILDLLRGSRLPRQIFLLALRDAEFFGRIAIQDDVTRTLVTLRKDGESWQRKTVRQ